MTSGLMMVAIVLASGVAPARVAAVGAVPTFLNGLSQNVFSSSSSTWIRGEAWVESAVDGDLDGLPDRIHVDITRPQETETDGLKVPVILEESPYYAGLGPDALMDWPVDHELGFPPTSKDWHTDWTATYRNPISSIYNSTWLPRGFAVVHAESPGTGQSQGCPIAGGPDEIQAAKSVVDWLAGRATAYTSVTSTDEVPATWSSGKIGMIGTSYNGTLPIAVATTGVAGLEAIVPISAISSWYEYYRANGLVRAPGGYQGEDLEIHGEAVYSRADREICKPQLQHLTDTEDRATGDYNAVFDERNYLKNANKIHAAVLLAHGNNDWNVMLKTATDLYKALQANNIPHQFYLHQGGHGGSPPDVMINRWFTRYLYGVENGVENEPKAWVVRESNACPPRTAVVTGDQSNVSTLTVADSSQLTYAMTLTVPQLNSSGTTTNTTRVIQAVPDSTHVVLASAVATATGQKVADGTTVSIATCSSANPTPYPDWPDADAAPAVLRLTPGAPARGGLTFEAVDPATTPETLTDDAFVTATTSMNAATSDVRLIYETPILTSNIRISGTPTVSLRIAFSKPKANLTARLISYPGTTGNGTMVDRGWMDPENRTSISVSEPIVPGQFYDLTFDLQPKDNVIVAGRRLAVMIISSDYEHTIRPAPGTQLTVDLAHSSLQLPIVGGAAALASATGVIAPTVDYTLDPASPNGSNGWYSSGDIDLTWQTNDTGAETATTGCVDETFSSDGVFDRSCTRTNVVDTASADVTVMRDTVAPTVTLDNVVDGGLYYVGIEPACTSSDATSGVDSPSVLTTTLVDGGPVAGTFHAECSAATDVAGNTSAVPAGVTYQVRYDFSPGFTVKGEIKTDKGKKQEDSFNLDGRFVLAPDSDGIDPQTEPVTLTIGDWSVTVPAGSFKKHDKYHQKIDGDDLKIDFNEHKDHWDVKLEGKHLDGLPSTNPVTITLTVGYDSGTVMTDLKLK